MIDSENLPPVSCLKQAPLNKVRCDKFILTIDMPLMLRQQLVNIYKDASIIDNFQINLTNAQVPLVSIPNIPVVFDGQTYNTSSHTRPTYSSLNLSFFIDTHFINYWLLWNWLNLFNEANTARGEKTSQLVSRFRLSCLDEYNSPIINFFYEDVFITELGKFDVDYTNTKQLKASATFVFNRMHLQYPQT